MRTMTTRTKLVTMLWLLAAAAPAQEITWAGLPALAEQAPSVQASRWYAQAAEGRRGGLARAFQPQVTAGAFGRARASTLNADKWPSAEPGNTWPEVQAGVDWNLWRGGRDRAISQAADAAARVATLQAQASSADLLLSLRQSFLRASLSKKLGDILADSEAQTREDLAKAEKKANAGLTSRTDVREFELRLLALRQERAAVEDELDQEVANLAALSGVRSIDWKPELEAWPEKAALERKPGLDELIEQSNADSQRWEAQAEGRWPLPALDLGLGLIQGGEDGTFLQQQDYRASVGLSVSLWDGGGASAARSALESGAKAFEALAASAQASRAAASDLAERRMDRWLGQRPDLEKRVEAAAQFRQGVIQEYLKGVRDGRDLEEATKAGEEARRDLEQARTTAWLLWAEFQHLAAAQVP